jgi:hypothetical protein
MDKDYLTLKRANASRPSGQWRHDDYDVICDGAVVGRIMHTPAAPEARPWRWSARLRLSWRSHPTFGYEATREAAMAAFAKGAEARVGTRGRSRKTVRDNAGRTTPRLYARLRGRPRGRAGASVLGAPHGNVPYPQALKTSRRTASEELPTLATAAASSSLLQPSVSVQ